MLAPIDLPDMGSRFRLCDSNPFRSVPSLVLALNWTGPIVGYVSGCEHDHDLFIAFDDFTTWHYYWTFLRTP